ncbi:unnamed protein product [Clonostachys byssicola]|uniref:C2H2-type domain-containing protein n=1 Tax=Clonostachys byssicola TaxID=160290 RepID=A0A9N9Y987_9HYPO|nr:unnamed protein product [Clonostachys byssicola]
MASADYYTVSPPSDDFVSSCSAGQMSSAYQPRPKSPPRIQTNNAGLGMSEPSSPIASSLSSSEKTRMVAIMAIELLAFEGKLHNERTNWACPFVICKENFPTAKLLMRHVPFCKHFDSQKVFCNMCCRYDCLETHELPTSSSLSTQKRALRKFAKIFTRSRSPIAQSPEPEEVQRISSPQSRVNTVSPSSSMSGKSATMESIFESPRQIKMQSPSPVHSPDLLAQISEMGGNPISELDDSLVPQELPDPVHQPQMLPNIGFGQEQDACNQSTQHEISGFQPLLHDTTANIDLDMEDEILGFNPFDETSFTTPFSHHDAGREMPAQNFGSQEGQADVNFMYQNAVSEFPTEFSTKQLPHTLLLNTGSMESNHQTGSEDSSAPSNPLPNVSSQPSVGNKMPQRPHISIQVNQLSGNPWPVPPSAKSTLLSSPWSASQSSSSQSSSSHPSSATTLSPFTPISRRAHQFNTSLESPITPAQPDVQIFKCPHCDYVTTGEKTGSYPTYFKKHLETHADNKFPCPGCKKSFTRKDNLNVHMKGYCSSLRVAGSEFSSLQTVEVGETTEDSQEGPSRRCTGCL